MAFGILQFPPFVVFTLYEHKLVAFGHAQLVVGLCLKVVQGHDHFGHARLSGRRTGS